MHSLPILRSTSQLRSRIRSWRAFGETVAVAQAGPQLHEGQLGLIRAARREADRVLVALADWRGGADAALAPADEDEAAERAEEAGADALFLPAAETLLPKGEGAVRLEIPGMLDVLCGEDAPRRFADFALASVRLLSRAQADVAVYPETEWQRLAIMRRVAEDLALPTEIRVAPAERDMDGLAYVDDLDRLSAADRALAPRLHRELTRLAAAIDAGGEAEPLLDAAADALADAGCDVDYLDLRDAETLAEMTGPAPGRQARVFGAIRLGEVRLSDSVALGETPGGQVL